MAEMQKEAHPTNEVLCGVEDDCCNTATNHDYTKPSPNNLFLHRSSPAMAEMQKEAHPTNEVLSGVEDDCCNTATNHDCSCHGIPAVVSSSECLGKLMDMLETGLSALAKEAGGAVGWKVFEKDDALHLEVNMPHIMDEDVQVSAEKGTLIIEGEEEEENAGGEEAGKSSRRTFGTRLDLPEKEYKVDQFRAEMNDGVLKIVVPKI